MVKILLFAGLKDQLKQDYIKWEKPVGTIGELRQELQLAYPNAAWDQAMAAVNETFADRKTKVDDGDTVAFIPPVSGG